MSSASNHDDNEDEEESVQINLRVKEWQKEEWEEYWREDGDFTSLSDLIRKSVSREISSDEEESEMPSPAITSDIQDLKRNLERVRKDVSWLREQSQDDVDISGLAQRVFDELEPLPQPPASVGIPDGVEDEDTYLQQRAALQVLTPDDTAEADEESVESYTIEALSNRLGEREDRIEDALDHLEDQFLPVIEVELTELGKVDPDDDQEDLEDQLGEVRDKTHFFKEE